MSDFVSRHIVPGTSVTLSRRSVCAVLGFGAVLAGRQALAKKAAADWLLAEQYALMRRAYQTGDAEILRQFYAADIVLATEGASPVVGLEAMIAMGHQLLPKRRDITAEILRVTPSPAGDAVSHVVKLSAYPRDAAEPARIATAFLSWQRSAAGWRCHSEVLLIQDMSAAPGLRTTPL
jgi:hypothetical protein